jgi:hypothetical protein
VTALRERVPAEQAGCLLRRAARGRGPAAAERLAPAVQRGLAHDRHVEDERAAGAEEVPAQCVSVRAEEEEREQRDARQALLDKCGGLGNRKGHVGRSEDGGDIEEVAEEGEDEEEHGETLDSEKSEQTALRHDASIWVLTSTDLRTN